eukprot:scaffold135655_cov32-Tisochrysis_lutea.AAC.1
MRSPRRFRKKDIPKACPEPAAARTRLLALLVVHRSRTPETEDKGTKGGKGGGGWRGYKGGVVAVTGGLVYELVERGGGQGEGGGGEGHALAMTISFGLALSRRRLSRMCIRVHGDGHGESGAV